MLEQKRKGKRPLLVRMRPHGMSALALLFFFNDPATTEIYTLSLHDALPISPGSSRACPTPRSGSPVRRCGRVTGPSPSVRSTARSEEHTSELQSRGHLV